ncbi:MAG TPA: hypothetical protein DIU15_17490, partial [Deltaproteobacteria bacterium]|nr:hypothetical protein [Deltaproteobacteria bacterium]
DTDDTVYPGASDILDDGVDQDCNGEDTTTCEGDHTITGTDAVLDGLVNCGVINGNFTIVGTSLETLSDLSRLTSVVGNVEISGNANLTTLGGLSALTTVGGNLTITDNAQLTEIALEAAEPLNL